MSDAIAELIKQRNEAIAERDAALVEVEQLRTRRGDCICDYNPTTTDGPSEDCPQHGRPYAYWVERSDAALARLGVVAALADEWDEAASRPMPKRADTETAQDQGVRIGVWHSVRTAATELRERLADSAGAIAKREQELRAEAWDKGATDGFTDAARTLPTILASNPYRADALTEGQVGE